MAKVQPSCRYDHGPLVRQDGLWALEQMERTNARDDPDTPFRYTQTQFVTSLFRCRTCGYLELFDDAEATP